MGGGMETALGEITLVLFTTLSPAGVMALVLMALPVVAGRVQERERVAIDRCMCIPIAVALVGLVASTTHLGNPANALYVLAGVGRSPLSNEVLSGVVFLGAAGTYWLTSFSERPRVKLRRAGLAFTCVTGVVFVCAIALAYDADTIITWNSVYVPLALWLNALLGGPLLALVGLRAAGFGLEGRYGAACVALALVSLVANTVVYGAQGVSLMQVENHMTSASAQVPGFFGMLCAFAVLGVIGVSLAALTRRRTLARFDARLAIVLHVCACVIAAIGIFIMRFAFYMMHLTVGLGA